MRFVNYCIPFLFTICTVSQLFWNRVCTSEHVIQRLKALFARFGIPEQIVRDNGPQFSSEAWRSFCDMYDTRHVTSSQHNPQVNGHAERAVQTAKRILKQDDPVVALMCFRATPTSSTGVSPA